MRSDSGNPLTTLVMFIPLVAVPALAIFGVPDWFSKAAASTSSQSDTAPDFQLKMNSNAPEVAPAAASAHHENHDGHSHHRQSNPSSSNSGNDEWEPPNWDQGNKQAGAANQPLSTDDDPFDTTAPRRSASNSNLSDEYATTQSSQQSGFEFDQGRNEREDQFPIDLDSRPSPFVETSGQEGGSEESQGVEYASAEGNDNLGDFFADNFDQSESDSNETIDDNSFADNRSTSGTPEQQTQEHEPRRFAERSEQQTLESALNEFESGRGNENNVSDGSEGQTQPARKRSNPALNWQTAIDTLNSAGVYEFALKKSANTSGYIFRCVYRDADRDDLFFRFEAEAAKPLEAVNDVVGQVVRWSRRN